MARPSDFTQEIADEICERVAESDYGLEQICDDDDMPSARTVFRWLAKPEHEAFRQQYARAKEVQGHIQFGRGVKEALTATDAQLGRLKLDARKWAAAKLAPKVYGEKVALVGGNPEEGDQPIQTAVDVSSLTLDQLRVLAAIPIPK